MGLQKEEITSAARRFHQLIREHSKLKALQTRHNVKQSASVSKRCSRNFWKFSQELLSDDTEDSNVKPNFNADEAVSFFSSTYSTPKSRDETNKCPSGLNVKSPSSPLVTKPISVLEIQAKIKCSRTSSAPSPIDGISYVILKKCPSILPVLMDLYNCCWTSCSIPQLWKTGIVRLIPKVGAAKTPEDPSKFRPIVLTLY